MKREDIRARFRPPPAPPPDDDESELEAILALEEEDRRLAAARAQAESCSNCHLPGHQKDDCPSSAAARAAGMVDCRFCLEPGHQFQDCPYHASFLASKSSSPQLVPRLVAPKIANLSDWRGWGRWSSEMFPMNPEAANIIYGLAKVLHVEWYDVVNHLEALRRAKARADEKPSGKVVVGVDIASPKSSDKSTSVTMRLDGEGRAVVEHIGDIKIPKGTTIVKEPGSKDVKLIAPDGSELAPKWSGDALEAFRREAGPGVFSREYAGTFSGRHEPPSDRTLSEMGVRTPGMDNKAWTEMRRRVDSASLHAAAERDYNDKLASRPDVYPPPATPRACESFVNGTELPPDVCYNCRHPKHRHGEVNPPGFWKGFI